MQSVKALCRSAGWKRLVHAAFFGTAANPGVGDAGRDARPAAAVLPQAGVRVASAAGEEWIVRAVFYDEAGPASILVIPVADLASGRLEAAFPLDVHAWCAFIAGKVVGAKLD